MIVYATSDLHGQLPEFPSDAELLLIAGDLCPDFRPMYGNRYDFVDTTGSFQSNWLRTTFRDWLFEAPCPVVTIWGNHDFVGHNPRLVPQSMPSWNPIQDEEYQAYESRTFDPLRIWGTPWVPGLPRWAFYGSDEALQARAAMIPLGLDVLMSHGPPANAGDYIPGGTEKQANKYGNLNGIRVGDPALNDAIERARPKIVICGHIHEDRGGHEVAGVPVYNVAAVDENYVMRSNPWVRLYELES